MTSARFFQLTKDNEKIVNDFMRQNNVSKIPTEFEIRFGSFISTTNKTTQQKTKYFSNDSDIDFFYKLKKAFDASVSVQRDEQITKECIYKCENGNMKEIYDQSGNISYILKQSVKKYDIFDYNFRLSLATEQPTKEFDNRNYNCSIIRDKTRYSYKLDCGRLDLTIVKESIEDSQSKIKYEVELEVSKNASFQQVMCVVQMIIQTRQGNYFIIPQNEKRNILYQYKQLLNTYYFIGAQPETLQRNDLSRLYKERYSVTNKADGDRVLLFVSNEKNVYFIDSNMNNVYKTDMTSEKYHGCLIDGELIVCDKKLHFLAFDLIAFNNKDIRGDNDYHLETRLSNLHDIVDSFTQSYFYVVSVKKFYMKNVFLGAESILNNKESYENDGLIFTPMDEPYPRVKKWVKLLKWKPAHMNTIDFYAVKNKDNNIWRLYVQHPKEKQDASNYKATEHVLFDVAKLCPEPIAIQSMMFETSFDEIDPTTNELYQSNTVIEFNWDKNLNKFVPLRTRWDKTANPRKHGNFSVVACDIWHNIHNPVYKEDLFKFTILSSAKEDSLFERMRKFHNKIKETLYNKYTHNTNYLLELCSGRGGDLHKWSFNNVQNVVGYDISEKSISECNRRNSNPNYKFYKQDLCHDNAFEIIMYNNPDGFDNVCCQFGLHYFFQSEKTFSILLKILDNSLKENGHFIVTFMDDTKIEELMKGKLCHSKEENQEVVYYIKKNDIVTESEFGNKLRIALSGSSILSEGSDEYLINYGKFIDTMNARGYVLVESELFENTNNNNMTSAEKDISNLNRYCVFQKSSSAAGKVPLCTPFQSILDTSFTYDIINLHKNNMSVVKLSTTYDVIDVLNSIEYKYYKNLFDEENIVTFSDISSTLQKYSNGFYQGIYIKDPLDSSLYPETTSKHTLYFCYHKHIIERKKEGDEDVEYENWYVIMNANKLFFSQSNIFHIQQQPQTIVEGEECQTIVEQEECQTIVEQKESQTIVEQKECQTIVDQEESHIIVEQEESQTIVEGESQEIVEQEESQSIVEVEESQNESEQLEYIISIVSNPKVTVKCLKTCFEKLGLKGKSTSKENLKKRLLEYIHDKQKLS